MVCGLPRRLLLGFRVTFAQKAEEGVFRTNCPLGENV